MEIVVMFFLVVGVCIAIVLNLLAKRQLVEAAWSEAAQELKLHFIPGGLFGRGKIRGELGGFPVRAEIVTRGSGEDATKYTRVVVDMAGRMPRGVSFVAESSRSVLGKVFTGQDMQTGDYQFDDTVYVRGPEVPLRAALNAGARRRIVEMVTRGATVKDGTICEERLGVVDDAGYLSHLLEQAAAAARELAAGAGDIQRALLENARGDPVPEVRLLNLKALVQRDPASPAASEALIAALDDPDGRLRLLWAAALRTPSSAAVLASLVSDPSMQPDVRAEALRALGQGRPYAEVAPTLAAALDDADQMVQREAVALAGKFRDASLYDRIVRLGPRAGDELAEAMAQTLGQLGDRKAERPLLLLLARDSIAVKIASATALGLVGSIDAVEPLLPLVKGLLESAELKEAAREAIRRIQARLGDADAGRLSLLGESEQSGALSIAAPTGAVSLSQPPDPKRSKS
jgi:HEAT repeat protein